MKKAAPKKTATKPKTEKKRDLTASSFGGLFGITTKSGITVNESSALALSTLWRAARVVSETIGTMPLKVYTKTADGRDEARDSSYWHLLHDEPNPDMSSVDFLSLLMWQAVLYGNGFAEIVRDGSGQVTSLFPIPAWTVNVGKWTVKRVDKYGREVEVLETCYKVSTDQGELILPASDVLHIKGPSPDGSCGYRLVQLARESLGYSMALDAFGASYFGNSCKVGGVLSTAGMLSDQARDNIREGWIASYSGVDNAGKVPVLEEGLVYTPFEVSNESGQYLENRQHQIYEVCRWVGVDPIFVYEYGRATWNNAEAQTRNFLQFSLNVWLRKLECEIARKIIRDTDVYAEFVRESVIQMDAKTQSEVWKTGVEAGWYTPNEVRKWLNLPPLPEPQTVVTPLPAQNQNPQPQTQGPDGNAVDQNQPQ
jgi:HK97 family phage portal protein